MKREVKEAMEETSMEESSFEEEDIQRLKNFDQVGKHVSSLRRGDFSLFVYSLSFNCSFISFSFIISLFFFNSGNLNLLMAKQSCLAYILDSTIKFHEPSCEPHDDQLILVSLDHRHFLFTLSLLIL